MSDIEKMVSVPREVAEAAWQALDDDGRFEESCPLREALDLPAEQHQGEPVGEAVAFGESLHEIAWAQGKLPRLGAKLYTHADPGEVERLRAELKELRESMVYRSSLVGKLEQERDTLRAQLAERDALLRECQPALDQAGYGTWQIDELLSASAEPSAPVEIDERAEFEACIRRKWPQAPTSRKRDLLPKDDPCYGEYCDEPMQRAWLGWQLRAALSRKP